MTSALLAVSAGQVRPAETRHLPSMAELIDSHAKRGLMLPRSLAELKQSLADFVVVEDALGVVAMGGLRFYGSGSAEVIGLAVRQGCRGGGLGRRVVERLRDRAKERGATRLFALTLEPVFFGRLGFEATSFHTIPEKVRRDCRHCPFRVGCRETPVSMDLPQTLR